MTPHEERVRKAWGFTGRIAIIGILAIVAILAVQSRMAVVEACRDRNVAITATAEARKVQRAFIDAAADARVTSGRRNPDLVVAESDLATAAFYRSLIRRTTVPKPVHCPTFWHN
jgi:hypothetical protein